MAKRYSGDLEIEVEYSMQGGFYRAIVRHGDRVLWAGNVRPRSARHESITGTSPEVYDAAARTALAEGEGYASGVASQLIVEKSEEDERGYYKVLRRAPRRSSRNGSQRRDAPSVGSDPSRQRRPRGRYEIRAWAPSPRARRGEVLVRTFYIYTDDPHYAAVELYRLPREQEASGAYGRGRWRYEAIDHGPGAARKLGQVVTYEELVRRAKSLTARDRARGRRERGMRRR